MMRIWRVDAHLNKLEHGSQCAFPDLPTQQHNTSISNDLNILPEHIYIIFDRKAFFYDVPNALLSIKEECAALAAHF